MALNNASADSVNAQAKAAHYRSDRLLILTTRELPDSLMDTLAIIADSQRSK
jgi:hypothetical protein